MPLRRLPCHPFHRMVKSPVVPNAEGPLLGVRIRNALRQAAITASRSLDVPAPATPISGIDVMAQISMAVGGVEDEGEQDVEDLTHRPSSYRCGSVRGTQPHHPSPHFVEASP